MAKNAVWMDTSRVTEMSGWFQQASGILKGVSTALKVAMELLQATAFIGLVGGLALQRYIASVQPVIEELSEYCAELSRDLKSAVEHYENASAEGASRFH
jgi:hypothetical protein